MGHKYDFIVLPPDAFHMTLRDRLSDARKEFSDVVAAISHLKRKDQTMLVKYRSENHRSNFPFDIDAAVGYGSLLDFCHSSSVVVGFPGSAAIECWLSDIEFYPFWDYRRILANRYLSKKAVNRFLDIVHVATTVDELRENIRRGRIFREGKSKRDILFETGLTLESIVFHVLSNGNGVGK